MTQIITVYDKKKKKRKYIRKINNRTWLTSYDVTPLLKINFKFIVFLFSFLVLISSASAALTSNKIVFANGTMVYLLDKTTNTTISTDFTTTVTSVTVSHDGNNYIVASDGNTVKTYASDLTLLHTASISNPTGCIRHNNYYYCSVSAYDDGTPTRKLYARKYNLDGTLVTTYNVTNQGCIENYGMSYGETSVDITPNGYIHVSPFCDDPDENYLSSFRLSDDSLVGRISVTNSYDNYAYINAQEAQVTVGSSATTTKVYTLNSNGSLTYNSEYTRIAGNYPFKTSVSSWITANATHLIETDGTTTYTYAFGFGTAPTKNKIDEYTLSGASTQTTGNYGYTLWTGIGSQACGLVEPISASCIYTGSTSSGSCSQDVSSSYVNVSTEPVLFTGVAATEITNLQDISQVQNWGDQIIYQPFNEVQNTSGDAKLFMTYADGYNGVHTASADTYSHLLGYYGRPRLKAILGIENLVNITTSSWFGLVSTTVPCLGSWRRAVYVGYNSSHVEVFAFRCSENYPLYAYDGIILPKTDPAVPTFVNETTTSTATYAYVRQAFDDDATASLAQPIHVILEGTTQKEVYTTSTSCSFYSDDPAVNYTCALGGNIITGTAYGNEETYIYQNITTTNVTFNILSERPQDYICRYRGTTMNPDASGKCSYSNVPLNTNLTFYLTHQPTGRVIKTIGSTDGPLNEEGFGDSGKCSGYYVYNVDVTGASEVKNLRIYVYDTMNQPVQGTTVMFGADTCVTGRDGTCILYDYLLERNKEYPISFKHDDYGRWTDVLIDYGGTIDNGAYDFIFYAPAYGENGVIGANAFKPFEELFSIGNIILFFGLLVCLALVKFAGGQAGMLAGAIFVIWAGTAGLLPSWLSLLVIIVAAALAAYKISGRDTGG